MPAGTPMLSSTGFWLHALAALLIAFFLLQQHGLDLLVLFTLGLPPPILIFWIEEQILFAGPLAALVLGLLLDRLIYRPASCLR